MTTTAIYLMVEDDGVDIEIEATTDDRVDRDGWRTLCLSHPAEAWVCRVDGHRQQLRAMLEAALKLLDLDDGNVEAMVRENGTTITKLYIE